MKETSKKVQQELPVKLQIKWTAKKADEKAALKIIRKLQAKHFTRSYIVGGYVRDFLMRRPPLAPPYKGGESTFGAIDIATEATPDQVQRIFKKDFSVIPTGLKHGTVTLHKGKIDIEVTTFRSEGKYSDHRRPDKVNYIKDPELDSARRDFTVNALFFNPIKKEIIDYQGGLADIKASKLRFVGVPEKRIDEDPLRLMRAVRFAATLDLKLGNKDRQVIKRRSSLIKKISPERVKQELDKILLSGKGGEGLHLLRQVGILDKIIPEVAKTWKTRQSANFHSEGTVFIHTMLALSMIEKLADLAVRYGLLFHDLGKAETVAWKIKDGRKHSTFYGHQESGVEIAQKIMKRLRFSNKEYDDVSWFIRHHHVPYELSKMRVSKQNTWLLDDRFERLLQIYRADSLAAIPTDRRGRKMKPSLESYNYSVKALKKARSKKVLQKKLVSGDVVMRVLKIKPGPDVGKFLARVRERQLAGKLKNKKEALKFLKGLK